VSHWAFVRPIIIIIMRSSCYSTNQAVTSRVLGIATICLSVFNHG